MSNEKDHSTSDTSVVISAYRYYKEIKDLRIKIPKVIEIPFVDDFIENINFAIFNKNTNSFEPYYFKQDNIAGANVRAIRFLAQPNNDYRIYFDPDRSKKILVQKAGNLYSIKEKEILKNPEVLSQTNSNYIIADTDKDGVPNIKDNCTSVANSDQKDLDYNNRGDACDDFDQDGLINSEDNCPDQPNRDQMDEDGDNIGNICDKEESRITEKYTWLPWLGMGLAGLVLIILLALMVRSKPKI
jgi:hypothetical protein